MHACVRGLAGVPCVSSTYGLTIDGEWLRQRLLGHDFVERALLLPPEMRVERAGMHSLTLEWSAPPTIPKFPVTGYCILAAEDDGSCSPDGIDPAFLEALQPLQRGEEEEASPSRSCASRRRAGWCRSARTASTCAPSMAAAVVCGGTYDCSLRTSTSRRFEYCQDFDENGVLHWLGTGGGMGDGRRHPYRNPAKEGRVAVLGR